MAKLTKFEALQLAAAFIPESILTTDGLQDENARVQYLFDVAELITQEDSRRESAKLKPVEVSSS